MIFCEYCHVHCTVVQLTRLSKRSPLHKRPTSIQVDIFVKITYKNPKLDKDSNSMPPTPMKNSVILR